MGINNVRGGQLYDENICNYCKRLFNGQGIRSLGGQIACSEPCAERLRPINSRDKCYGCDQMVWEFSYLTLRDTYIFCNLECLSKYLSTEEPIKKRPKSPFVQKRKLLLEKVLPGQITNKVPGMRVKYEKKRNKSL